MLLERQRTGLVERPIRSVHCACQGSAKIRLPDGQLITMGYAANNGYEYKSIGRTMVEQGEIDSSQLSLTSLIKYFKEHPDRVSIYTQLNPRFVFFPKG